jgi:hypothetical protein
MGYFCRINNKPLMKTLEKRKINFIEKYLRVNNPATIDKLEKILDDDLKKEELILTEELEKMLEAGLDSLDSGKGIQHNDVLLRLKSKYSTFQF